MKDFSGLAFLENLAILGVLIEDILLIKADCLLNDTVSIPDYMGYNGRMICER
jgi:hypothetical protein